MIFLCIPCLSLIIYFLIVSIFFPKYRVYIIEGWNCFLDKLKGKKCSISFDNRMRLAFSAWLTKKGMVRLGRFFYKEKNFNMTLTVLAIIFTLVSILLFVLMIKFFIHSPCEDGSSCKIPVS